MTTALVTGGSGFLGSFIADELSRLGQSVRVFDRNPSPYLKADQQMFVGDVRDGAALAEAAAGCDLLFHLAGVVDLEEARDRPHQAAEVNVLGTINALEAARHANVERFLFASSVYVYSRAGGFYRCSKQACEAFIEEYQRKFDLPFTVLRYGSLYGPRSGRSNGVLRLLEQAAASATIRHIGSPEDTREYVHVEDAARLTVEALDARFENSHLTVTGSHPMRLKDLFTMFSEILGRDLEIDYQAPPEGRFDEHYRITPYAFTPRVGRKLTSNHYVDMGQGILQLLEQIQAEQANGSGEKIHRRIHFVNAAIVTARAGSKSIADKNVFPVGGKPLVSYPIEAAGAASKIASVFVSTDGESIAAVGRELGCTIIERPDALGGDSVNHGDVIKHAVEWVDKRHPKLANVVLLLGNTVMIDGEIIDRCLRLLEERPDLDSVMTVWEAADDHPLRALEVHNGLLQPFGDPGRQVSTERQSYPKAYYYDQGVWAFRKECVQERRGPSPWWWMGEKCAPVIRPWVTGRDVHTSLDVAAAEWWLGSRLPDHLS